MKAGPVIVGIAGGTGSGKTTVAASICNRVGRERIEWISHDSYYREFRGHDPEARHHVNFDHPDSLETELLVRHLDELIAGRAVETPIYDFTTHSRLERTTRVEPRRVVIVEGILVLGEAELRKRIDIKLFVDTPPDIRFVRRLLRDVQTRGRTIDSVVHQYLTTVRPMHEEFVEPSKRFADLIIPEGGENRVALDAIIARVEHLLVE
ncbi:MAG TPA: uridine kinase [Thermoanaerobaculia bacterium]|nr:uridine kinase [Thermoanaerobaculia bacterium]